MTSARISRVWGTILLTITISSLNLPAYAKYSGGTGEPNDPYQIATADDLIALGDALEDYDKHFVLTADINLDPNLPGRKVFDRAVIGVNWKTHFTGVFDGNDHMISHLTITGRENLGLFGFLGYGAKISNLGLEGVEVKGTYRIGGLVGENYGSISSSYNAGVVSGANYDIGGLVGCNFGDIAASYSTGTVRGHIFVGGLVGGNGGSLGGSITASYSTGTVSGDYDVGGLVGGNGASITTSYSTGSVSGDWRVGGLVGLNNSIGSIAMSYSTGAVTGSEYVGGLVGDNRCSITTSFWDMETSGHATSAGGTGLTTAEMQDVDTYLNAGWDLADEIFNGTCDYWQISSGNYPRLCYQTGNGPVMPEGSGTPEQPYLIRDARDLGTVWFKPMAHYRLEESVDLSGITWSVAVVPCFGGTFDVNGHVISNLQIQGGGFLGLFGQLGYRGKISNLVLKEVGVNGIGDYVGSVVGNNDGSITASHSIGMVSGKDSVGGLVGFNNYGGNISMSHSTSTVTGGWNVGGLTGRNDGSINNSYSTGSVTGDGYVGGLVGRNLYFGDVTECYSAGAVRGSKVVGGLVGWTDWGKDYGGVVVASFWDTQTSGQSTSSGGVGKTTTEMQMASTFLEAGWDFVDETTNGTEDIWWIIEGQHYPRLWWERTVWFADYTPLDPNEYGIKTFEWIYGQTGEYTRRIGESEIVPYLSGPITGVQIIENNNTLVGTNDGLNVSFLASGEWILSTDPNLTAHPPVWSFAGLYDGMIIDQGVWYLVKKDMSEWEVVNNQQLLIDIQDIIVPEGHHNNAVVFWYLDTAYSFTPLDFHGKEFDMGITLPSSSQATGYSVTGFDIYAVNTGLIAHGDIDAATGSMNDLAVLKQVE